MSSSGTRWPMHGMPSRDQPLSLPERWRQAIARRGQPEPTPEQARVAEPEDFADTQPDCHGP